MYCSPGSKIFMNFIILKKKMKKEKEKEKKIEKKNNKFDDIIKFYSTTKK